MRFCYPFAIFFMQLWGEARPTPEPGSGMVRWKELAAGLSDCRAIVVSGVGSNPKKVLSDSAMEVIECEGIIEAAVDEILDALEDGQVADNLRIHKGNQMIHATAPEWQEHITAGQKYLKTAGNGLARPSVFNNELIYQLTAMAVEKLLVGVFQYHRKMPADHTLEGLVDELVLFCPLDNEPADRIIERFLSPWMSRFEMHSLTI